MFQCQKTNTHFVRELQPVCDLQAIEKKFKVGGYASIVSIFILVISLDLFLFLFLCMYQSSQYLCTNFYHIQLREMNENGNEFCYIKQLLLSVFEALFFFSCEMPLIEALTSFFFFFFFLLAHSESFPCRCGLCDEEVAEGGRASL